MRVHPAPLQRKISPGWAAEGTHADTHEEPTAHPVEADTAETAHSSPPIAASGDAVLFGESEGRPGVADRNVAGGGGNPA